MSSPAAVPLPYAVRGVRVHSRQPVGACAPLFGRVELDFEPLPAGAEPAVAFACTSMGFTRPLTPDPAPAYEQALAEGVLLELAAADPRHPDARSGTPVVARAVVRALLWHYTDSCDRTFRALGAVAVREALACVAEQRAPRLIDTRVRAFY
ncbi:hypothetical protein [Kitasatospora sp. LaBMicrA B282]|uniref:hypothetical protein n=1 Tax=Kitasatospora sp. LaBMicrA B282 TaxID=3420949 RepID=UPI003D0DBBE6